MPGVSHPPGQAPLQRRRVASSSKLLRYFPRFLFAALA